MTEASTNPAPTGPGLRSLLVAPEIFSSTGGIPRCLRAYLRALGELAASGGAVSLLSLNDSSFSAADLARHAGPSLSTAIACGRRRLRFVLAALRLARSCDHLVCGHIHLLPVAWLARLLNPRLRYHLVAHGIEVWRPFGLLERIALRGAHRVFCVSAHTRRELLARCPLPAERAVVLPNTLDPAFPIQAGQPLRTCPPVILAVSRLSWADRYKGVEHLIEALPLIRASAPEARLRIIGDGDDLPRLRTLAATHAVSDAVDFLGPVDDARLITELDACRLFALPSEREGFGLVYLEAMSRGRPCLGARAGGTPEVITPDSGRLVRHGDVPALAAGCVEALRADWDEERILAVARSFSYTSFRQRLAGLLSP